MKQIKVFAVPLVRICRRAVSNAAPAALVASAVRYEAGTALANSGALVAFSGAKTGRSPDDKRLVRADPSQRHVWWGKVNRPLSQAVFEQARARAVGFLATQQQRYSVLGFAGADPKYRIKIRVECTRAYHALFMQNMLIAPTEEELANFGDPDFTIYNAGQCEADDSLDGVDSKTLVAISFENKEIVILGTEYAGEMKKAVFTIMHYLMPLKGVLSLHSSANEGIAEKDVSLFFGLSGTGKTTLSADPNRKLIGDDEHCWSDQGIFNIEGGCYAKAIDLSPEKEPEIFNAIRFGAILENVALNPKTHTVDFSSRAITENTRVCYPIEFIPNAKIPGLGKHPKNIIFLTCDAYGVLPPVSLLSVEQAMYYFVSGYTSKVAGTEQGVLEPTATFSSCFGAPFLVHPPALYANMLAEKLQKHSDVKVWLLNTGWCGGAPGGKGGGQRIPLKYSRAIVDSIHSGELSKSIKESSAKLPLFDLTIPGKSIAGVPASIFNPLNAWKEVGKSEQEFLTALKKLKTLFDEVMAATIKE